MATRLIGTIRDENSLRRAKWQTNSKVENVAEVSAEKASSECPKRNAAKSNAGRRRQAEHSSGFVLVQPDFYPLTHAISQNFIFLFLGRFF
jgi:hypothetical protein